MSGSVNCEVSNYDGTVDIGCSIEDVSGNRRFFIGCDHFIIVQQTVGDGVDGEAQSGGIRACSIGNRVGNIGNRTVVIQLRGEGVSAVGCDRDGSDTSQDGRIACNIGGSVNREICNRHRTIDTGSAVENIAGNGSVFVRGHNLIVIHQPIDDGVDGNVQSRSVGRDSVCDCIRNIRHQSVVIRIGGKGVSTVGSDRNRADAGDCGCVACHVGCSVDCEIRDRDRPVHTGRAGEDVAGNWCIFRSGNRFTCVRKGVIHRSNRDVER